MESESMADSGLLGPNHSQQLFFDTVSPATRLLEKRRQMYEVQDALETQKATYAKKEIEHREEEENLRKKDLHLQHQLFRFNKFLQDNEAKRRRAETRAAEEAQQIQLKEKDIEELEKHLEESRRYCRELDEQVSKNTKYEKFLEKVKNDVQGFQELPDLLKRYDTLEGANRYLMQVSSASEQKIEELRAEYQRYLKDQEMQALSQTTQIAALQAELYEATKDRQAQERQLDEVTQGKSENTLKFGEILLSVENLYLRCTTTHGKILQHANTHLDDEVPKVGAKAGGIAAEDEPEEGGEDSFRKKQQNAIRQLKVIYDYLVDFKDMSGQVQKLRTERQTALKQKGKQGTGGMDPNYEPRVEFIIDGQPVGAIGAQNPGTVNAGQ